MRDSNPIPSNDHHQHQDHSMVNQDNFEKRMRYYTPQTFNNSTQNYESNKISTSFSNFKINDRISESQKNGNESKSQTKESELVTRFKSLFESGKVMKGALRTQSILRQCYTPNPVFEYRVEITPKIETFSEKELPDLPKNLTTGRNYLKNTQNIHKQFSSLSKTSIQNDSLFGIKKPLKQRPKLDELVGTIQDSNEEPLNNLFPALVSKAEAEHKNFLYDIYLKKAEDCLEEFENKKNIMNLCECLRQLDRCIEFYELALKTLSGDKNYDNSRVLLRTKQSKVILKKRHMWMIKSMGTQRSLSMKNGSQCDDGDNRDVNRRNDFSKHVNYHFEVSARTARLKDTKIVDRRQTPQLRPSSVVSMRSVSMPSSNDVHPKPKIYPGFNGDNTRSVYQRGMKLDSQCNKNTSQLERNKIPINKGNLNDILINKSTSNNHRIANPNNACDKFYPTDVSSICMKARRKLPEIPDSNLNESLDITSRVCADGQSFIKISLV